MLEEVSKIVKDTFQIRGLYDDTAEFFRTMIFEEVLIAINDNLDAQELGFGLYDGNGGIEDILIDKKLIPISFMNIIAHVKSFSSSAGLVKQGSIAVFEIG